MSLYYAWSMHFILNIWYCDTIIVILKEIRLDWKCILADFVCLYIENEFIDRRRPDRNL